MFWDSRSFPRTLVKSDHSLVAATFDPRRYYQLWNAPKQRKPLAKLVSKVDLRAIVMDPVGTRHFYQQAVRDAWATTVRTASNGIEEWKQLSGVIENAAKTTAPKPLPSKKRCEFADQEIHKWSTESMELREKIINTEDTTTRKTLKSERNILSKKIRRKIRKLQEERMEMKAREIMKFKTDGAKYHAAVKELAGNKHKGAVQVQDKNGNKIYCTEAKLVRLREYYQDKFSNPISQAENDTMRQQWVKPLERELNQAEVGRAVGKLNNGKAAGPDGIPGELLRYGPKYEIVQSITNALNDGFRLNRVHELGIGDGILDPLQKETKDEGPCENLRAVTSLNSIRKVLSLVTLQRIWPKVSAYLPASQCAYQPNKSTTDLIWAHRWIAATAERYNVEIHVLGTDMSAAFDTISRAKILKILRDEVKLESSELSMVAALLTDTEIKVKLEGLLSEKFSTSIGTPQGDCISAVLFIVYLESALRCLRLTAPPRPEADYQLPTEDEYADDVGFMSFSKAWLQRLLLKIPEIFNDYQLKVNTTKTEWVTYLKTKGNQDTSWKSVKKLGSLLGESEDVHRRKILALVSFRKLKNVWKQHKILSPKARIMAYQAYVESALLYGCETWGLTKLEWHMLDTFQRRLLRSVLGIKWPHRIRPSTLYKLSGLQPVSVVAAIARWRTFGRLLRQTEVSPAQISMRLYVNPPGRGSRGQPANNLPYLITKDLREVKPDVLTLRNNSLHISTVTMNKLKQIATSSTPGDGQQACFKEWDKLVDQMRDLYVRVAFGGNADVAVDE